ncbi:O-antigen ligase family protein [Paenibacillus humicola]|uniref:O-antigen ligase family protein n=1 Tax=Paenibacillus humicola TaxID=3110540 RepID=UPI00237A6B2F|nr:O-antigen ligase family protein [Paenibacillus humicola]
MRNDKLPKKKNTALDFSLIQWLGIILVSLFFIVSPFYQGLFNGYQVGYEDKLYGAMLAVFATLVVMAIFLFMKWQLNNYKSLLSIGILLLPVVYFFASFHAASEHFARIMILNYFVLAAFYIFGLYLINSNETKTWFVSFIQLSGYVIVVFGLLNLFGQVHYTDALWLADGRTYRLTSVFQYSNTYAGFLVALFLACLYFIVFTKRWYIRMMHAVMLVPLFTSFMLTYSRGAIVILPFLVLIILPFFRMVRQISYLLYMVLSILSTFIILSKITTNYDKIARIVQPKAAGSPAHTIPFWQQMALQSWLLVIVTSIVTALAVFACNQWVVPWFEKKLSSLSLRKGSVFVIPIIVVGIGVILSILVISSGEIQKLLPEQIAQRLENINFDQHSVLERETFYRDAFKVIRDYPILGTGGGGWATIYQKYQSNPYSSNQAHSYFIQTLVEVGVIGFVIVLAMIAISYILFIRLYIKHKNLQGSQFFFFIVSLSLLAHSMIDFDMSYLYYSSLVFFCLGAMLAPYGSELIIVKWNEYSNSKYKYIFPASVALLSIILFSWTMRLHNANQYYDQALANASKGNATLDNLLPDIDKAIKITPDHPTYTLTKVSLLSQAYQQTHNQTYLQQAKTALDRLVPYEPYNHDLILAQYRNFKDLGAYNNAINSLKEGISKFPWDINFYEAAMLEYFVDGQADLSTEPDESKSVWNQALNLYKEVLSRIDKLKDLPKEQLPGRPFELTPTIRLAIGGIYYFTKDYQQAIKVLEPMRTEPLTGNDPSVNYTTNRAGVRYYLASLHKTGKDDLDLQKKLISSDPNEKITLDQVEESVGAR